MGRKMVQHTNQIYVLQQFKLCFYFFENVQITFLLLYSFALLAIKHAGSVIFFNLLIFKRLFGISDCIALNNCI